MLVRFTLILASSVPLAVHAFFRFTSQNFCAPQSALLSSRSQLPSVPTSLMPSLRSTATELASNEDAEIPAADRSNTYFSSLLGRRSLLNRVAGTVVTTIAATSFHASNVAWAAEPSATKKCTDIESCREVGDLKILEDMKKNPLTRLSSGVKYKVLRQGTGELKVTEGSVVDLIYSVVASERYMYSQGFGYEYVNFDGKQQKDLGLDSLRIVVGKQDVPLGVEQALIGMKRGERRRVVVPPSAGFETSNWKPEPTTSRGKASMTAYKKLLSGSGPTQPPFPARAIWDVEVLSIRK